MSATHSVSPADDRRGKRVMWTYIISGLGIFALMVLVGILLRASQAGWFALDAGLFYSLLGLHGVGMLTALTISGLGTLWYLVNRETPLAEGVAYLAFGLFVSGVAAVIVSVVVGHYGALWTMLYPLPFIGTYWPSWATGVWLIGTLLVMVGWT